MAKITIEEGDHKYEIYTTRTLLTMGTHSFYGHSIKIEGLLDPGKGNLAVTYQAMQEVKS